MTGRADVRQGSRVQIASGLYAGEIAIVESVVGGVIPAAVVRTEAGRTRRVRTVDLIPTTAERKVDGAPAPTDAAPAASTEGAASSAPTQSPPPTDGSAVS
jgi:hypothetical protein